MIRKFTFNTVISFLLLTLLVAGSCGKGGGTTPPSDPCAGVTVSVTATGNNPSAPGASNGSISASATGGSGFTYSINGGAFQSSGSFTGLAAGSYVITAKNSNGCTGSSAAVTLTAPNPCAGVTISVTGTFVNPSTGGGTNGSITAAAAGGTGPYTYSRDGVNFQASGTFNNLTAGSYTITAKDANNCTGSSNFTLSDPCIGVTITVTATTTNPTAGGAANGSISASATGGTGPYNFRIGTGAFQASGVFNNLTAGTYSITARDANSCTGTANFTLTDPNPCAGVTINANTTVVGNILCATPATGSITSAPTGGTSPYTFSLNGGTFLSSGIFNNLAAGNYSLVIRDNNTCSTTVSISVTNRPQGPLFTQVKSVLQANCVSCHNSTNANGGMNWEVDCNIVNAKDRIQARAVNAVPGPMPPTGLMPASERQKIMDWINAGGRYTD
jgi:hypothetical protein